MKKSIRGRNVIKKKKNLKLYQSHLNYSQEINFLSEVEDEEGE